MTVPRDPCQALREIAALSDVRHVRSNILSLANYLTGADDPRIPNAIRYLESIGQLNPSCPAKDRAAFDLAIEALRGEKRAEGGARDRPRPSARPLSPQRLHRGPWHAVLTVPRCPGSGAAAPAEPQAASAGAE